MFPVAVTIHNAEEAVLLPGWAARHVTPIPWHISAAGFRIGAALVTAAAFLITWRSSPAGSNKTWTYLFVSYTAVMWLNVFVPHLPAVFWFRSYVPGAASALFVVLPVTTWLLISVIRHRIVPRGAVSALVFGIPLAIAAAVSAILLLRL